ncbi:hypothetical protein N7G274_008437 [Stereocaulon virgatum]|uniref:Uncharacterized protein n=1 Tax=Stereocaulon virgatum TaxID=373712 RepID=A0ABR3ZZL8_9LECA
MNTTAILSLFFAALVSLATLTWYQQQTVIRVPSTVPMASNAQGIIPVVALGVFRNVAAAMDGPFAKTPFRMVAILDIMTKPTEIQYNPHNFATVLYNLHPRPKVFITGAAIDEAMTAESITVWESYVRETKETDTYVINLNRELMPGGDWMTHIMKKLEARYGKV